MIEALTVISLALGTVAAFGWLILQFIRALDAIEIKGVDEGTFSENR